VTGVTDPPDFHQPYRCGALELEAPR
jgi:hypothetical protein